MRRLTLTFCLLAAPACGKHTPTSPTVPLNQQFTLAPGAVARIEATTLAVQFIGVGNDSRCPSNARCIWAGDAMVHVRVIDAGATTDYELHTGGREPASVPHRDVRITLVQLEPHFFTGPIPPGDYRATLQATR